MDSSVKGRTYNKKILDYIYTHILPASINKMYTDCLLRIQTVWRLKAFYMEQ